MSLHSSRVQRICCLSSLHHTHKHNPIKLKQGTKKKCQVHTSAPPLSITGLPQGPHIHKSWSFSQLPQMVSPLVVSSVTRVCHICQGASFAVLFFLPFQAPAGPGVWAPHPYLSYSFWFSWEPSAWGVPYLFLALPLPPREEDLPLKVPQDPLGPSPLS